jgi:hypothetical protein
LSFHEDDQPGLSGEPSGEIGRSEAEERGSCIPDTSSCKTYGYRYNYEYNTKPRNMGLQKNYRKLK